MAIPLPNLDDRRWLDLVEEGRALLPVYAPEWTDHNASDPGVTLMELLAWQAEQELYRVNRVPERHRRLLLALLGLRPEPPRAAQTVLSFELAAGQGALALPAGVECEGDDLAGVATRFRTRAALTLWPLKLAAVQVQTAQGFRDVTAALARGEALAVFGAPPASTHALYLCFDAPLPDSAAASLYVHCAGPGSGQEERRRLQVEHGDERLGPHHSVRLAWEHLVQEAGGARWRPLEVHDDTRALTLPGALSLRARGPMAAVTLGSVPKPLFLVRCRVAAGTYDAPPLVNGVALNAVGAEQCSTAEQTLTIARGANATGPAPTPGAHSTLHLELEAGGAVSTLSFARETVSDPEVQVLAYQPASPATSGRLTLAAEVVGRASGEPYAQLDLAAAPLIESSCRLWTLEDGAWQAWARRDDLAASTRGDRHVLLDPQRGRLRYGDGEHGIAPRRGALLLASYDSTRAAAGNLGARRVTRWPDTPRNRVLLGSLGAWRARVAVVNPWPAEGGREAETLAAAWARAAALREAPARAVTPADFEQLALETPGTRLARVHALPNHYPGLDGVRAPGVVSVVLVPDMPGPRPTPSAGLLQVVAARLERRRLVGTRVELMGPGFLEVTVLARVRAAAGSAAAALRARLQAALERFFDPLHGGPEGRGWPLGRAVYRSEVLQVLDETAGVDHVLALELQAGDGAPRCGDVCLPPSWLVASGTHRLEVV